MSEELKPLGCPHCGADLVLSPGNPTGVYAHLSGDLCFNGGIVIWSDDYDQITAWNRRSPLVGSSLGSLAQAALVPTEPAVLDPEQGRGP